MNLLDKFPEDPEAWIYWDRDVMSRWPNIEIYDAYRDSGGVLTVIVGAPGFSYVEFRRDPVPHWATGRELNLSDPLMKLTQVPGSVYNHWVYV